MPLRCRGMTTARYLTEMHTATTRIQRRARGGSGSGGAVRRCVAQGLGLPPEGSSPSLPGHTEADMWTRFTLRTRLTSADMTPVKL